MSKGKQRDPEKVIAKAEQERQDWQGFATSAIEWFLDRGRHLTERGPTAEDLAADLEIEDIDDTRPGVRRAHDIITHLVEDHVDPVQQIRNRDGQFVGILEFVEHDFWYEFKEYHDILGHYHRAVCGICVGQSERDSEPFTRHSGQHGSEPYDRDDLRPTMERHYLLDHADVDVLEVLDHIGVEPNSALESVGMEPSSDDLLNRATVIEDVTLGQLSAVYDFSLDDLDLDVEFLDIEIGATLASGTSISGNTAIHGGNQSSFDAAGFGGSGGTTGQFLQTDGSATTWATAAANAPNWVQDSASPISETGAQAHTITLTDGPYDQVRVKVQLLQNDEPVGQDMGVRINGDPGTDYDYRDLGGSSTSGVDMWSLLGGGAVEPGGFVQGSFDLYLSDTGMSIAGPFAAKFTQGILTGENGALTSDVSSITFRGASGNMTVKARVYGWNGGL